MRPFLLFLFLVGFLIAASQTITPILERRISINLNEESLPSALDRIGRLGGFSFSYSSSIISMDRRLTVKMSNKTIREILNEIFKGTIQYKEKAGHVILIQSPPPAKPGKATLVISGYVEDMESGEKISGVSVYEKESLTSAVTNQYGFYTIKLDDVKNKEELRISKSNYRDTIISVAIPGDSYSNIFMKRILKDSIKNESKEEVKDSLKQEKIVLQLPYASEPNVQNIHDTLYRRAQISFLPFLGTNGKLSGNVINDYSFNVLGGYSMGTRVMEIGGLFNIDRGNAGWFQLAGFGNMVGHSVNGFQAAGFFNVNGGKTKGVQIGGFANTNFDKTEGVQVAGFANTNLDSMDGVQVAGFTNYSRGSGVGVQVAGGANIQLGEYQGSQFAGIANVNTKKISGTQIAGFANIGTGQIGGSQISTFFNYGKKVKGVQIGFINYADSLNGVPIGLISIVKHGYHKLELSADEIFYGNVSFRTGIRDFYNILLVGMKPELTPDNLPVWTYGFGFGTARRITQQLYFNIDLTAQHINKGGYTDALSLLNKIHMGFDYQFTRKFSVYAGGTLNGYLTETTFTDYPTLFTNSKPNIFYDQNIGNNQNLKMWLGWKVGLRFF
ncbi:MAG TPA: carboxypeptidase-like regulatory domain-containing protein [Cyclobacteriaceae bacterium]|jgi:hypothetical protein|nr:carboxypeptidase-like regulatory domain-containing protein [Cyclobacteriaceae bacterium]